MIGKVNLPALLGGLVDVQLTITLFVEHRSYGRFTEPFYVNRIVKCIACGYVKSRGIGTLKATRASGEDVTFTCCLECGESAGQVLRSMHDSEA
jgi:hypothetical protein